MLELNKIYNEDCLIGLRKLPNESVDSVITDPPYGIGFVPFRETSRERLHNTPIANDEIKGEDWLKWFLPISKEIYRVMKNNTVAYFFCGYDSYYYYYSLREAGFFIKGNIIWVKNNFNLGYHLRRQYEQIVMVFKGNPPTPEWSMPDVIFEKKVPGYELQHSCQKPENIIRVLLKQYTKENDIVLDPFMGSGTTAVVCKQQNKKFIGYEIEKKYFDIAEKRLLNTANPLNKWF